MIKNYCFVIIAAFFILLPLPAFAADLNIVCGSNCTKTGEDPLFGPGLYWYPGRVIEKTITMSNTAAETRQLALSGQRVGVIEDLEQMSLFSITASPSGSVLWSGNLRNFYDLEKVALGTFAPDTSADFTLRLSLDQISGNEYREKTSVFDFTFGVWTDIAPTATPAPTSASGGGTTAGVYTAPVCDNAKPASAPVLLSADAGVNSVSLTWSAAADPKTYYLVAYGTAPGVYAYGNPNAGGPGAASYTVSGLSGGIRYYFKVRAGNGCMPGDYSNELSALPGGVFLGAGPAPGFAQGILGEATPSADLTAVPTESVLGQESSPSAVPGKPSVLSANSLMLISSFTILTGAGAFFYFYRR